jgi:hypothetical protein
MTAHAATLTFTNNKPLVWLVNSEDSSPAKESRNLIRANAAVWGHKTRRHGIRTPVRSRVALAPDLHFNVYGPPAQMRRRMVFLTYSDY